MLEVSLYDLLQSKQLDAPYVIYMLSKNGELAYIGQSQSVIRRLKQHLSKSAWNGSTVGKVIRLDAPRYEGWLVRLYTLSEASESVPEWLHGRLDMVEQYLISEHKPPFNTAKNGFPVEWSQALPDESEPLDGTANYIHI